MNSEELDAGLSKIPSKRRMIRNVEERRRMAYKLALLGLTEEEIGDFFGVSLREIGFYKECDEEFRDAIMSGREMADSRVAESLFECANGYYYDEEVSHVWKGQVIKTTLRKFRPKDPWACIKILALKHRTLWSETHRMEITNTNVNINKVDFSGLTTEELKILEQIQLRQLRAKVGDS